MRQPTINSFGIGNRLNRNTPLPTMIDSQGRPVDEDASKTELFNDFVSSV